MKQQLGNQAIATSNTGSSQPLASTRGMNKKLKAKWVKALCSGEYRQGHVMLKGISGYCCLGVLAEVAEFESDAECMLVAFGDYALLPQEEQKALAGLNDDGVPFEVIAGLIHEAL